MNHRLFLFALATALLGCGPVAEPLSPPPPLPPPLADAPPPVASATAQADFRATPPASGPETAFSPPRFEEVRLSNGVRVLIAERRGLPIVALVLAFDRGADQAPPGVASFTSAMLFQGTKKRDAIATSDALRGEGVSVGASADQDAFTVSAHCLVDKLPFALDILADVVQQPLFAKAEIERVRARRLTQLVQENDQTGALLTRTTLALLYPEGHPYHLSVLGDEARTRAITAANLQAFHAQNIVPERLTIAVAGDVQKAEIVAPIERAFGTWKGSAPKPAIPAMPEDRATARVTLVDRPGLTQSSVSVTVVGPPRLTADHDAIVLMNTLLGGHYSSRLNANLRERHAYTYGARSSFDFRRGPGPFSAGGTILREKTGAAIVEILSEIKRMREEVVTQEELDDARIRAIRRLPSRFESASATADAMVDLAMLGLPLDEYATLPSRLRKVTREDVQRAAATYLPEDRLRVVVVGDAAVVKAQLDALEKGEVVVKRLPKPVQKAGIKVALPKGGVKGGIKVALPKAGVKKP